MKPGEIITAKADIVINANKAVISVVVKNKGDRPIQVGSHFHFFETNSHLSFDRNQAYGYRLDIPAGTAVRFQPNETKTVDLVEIGGKRKIMGATGRVSGYLDEQREHAAYARVKE